MRGKTYFVSASHTGSKLAALALLVSGAAFSVLYPHLFRTTTGDGTGKSPAATYTPGSSWSRLAERRDGLK